MGRLAEIFGRERSNVAADPVRLVQEDRRELELKWRREEREASKIKAQVRKATANQEAALNVKLKELLRTVKAREALNDMRNNWGGKVDRVPYKINNAAKMLVPFGKTPILSMPPLPALGLALRYKFQDAGEANVALYYWNGKNIYEGSSWFRREMILAAIVGFDEEAIPYVASFYGSRISDAEYYLSGRRKNGGEIKGTPNYCLALGRDRLASDNTDVSQNLVHQFERLHKQAPNFRAKEAQAIERIQDMYDLPGHLRSRYSPFLQKRLLAHVPIAKSFLD